MRVFLIATNRHNRLMSRAVAQLLPLGLADGAEELKAANHKVQMFNLMFSADDLGKVAPQNENYIL